MASRADPRTVPAAPRALAPLPPGLRLAVVSGPDRGRAIALAPGAFVVGQAADCDLVLSDQQVSRRHLELAVTPTEIRVRDLGSSNGTFFEGARVEALIAGVGATFVIGETALVVAGPDALAQVPPSAADRFGELLGRSEAMRRVFTLLERVADSDAGVLLCGETGTGKELAAEGLHRASPRRGGPFVVCDLAASPRTLLESELFGHLRGAFTGAERDREGAFAAAHGGTLFLDEVGELDLELQPRLLRAIERRQVKPVGGADFRTVDVRVVAATNRDLGAEVRAGRFRNDLLHRLEVVKIELPPLRARREDIPLLVERFLARAGGAARIAPQTLAALAAHDWPGNVRQLRNVLERALALALPEAPIDAALLGLAPAPAAAAGAAPPASTPAATFKEAKTRLVEAWEREYLGRLLEQAEGNVSEAARRAGLSRMHLHDLLRKHGLDRAGGG